MKITQSIRAGLILSIAVLLRICFIQSRGIIYDDAFSIFLSRLPLLDIISGTAADTMPPLYYFLLHFWMELGAALWWIRLLNIILSLLGLGFLYLVVRELFNPQAALWTALIAAISPLQIYHAQDVRMYALMQLSLLVFSWCFIKIWKNSSGSRSLFYWMGLVVSGAAALYAHNLAGFGLLPAAIFLIIKRDWKFLGKLMGAYCLIGLLFLPWAFLLPGQFNKVQHAFWTPRPGLVEILQVIIQFNANLPLANLFWTEAAGLLAMLAGTIIMVECLRQKVNQNEKMLLALSVFCAPILTFIISYLVRPVFVARGFLVCSMFFYGLAGWVIAKNNKNFIGWFTLAIFMTSSIIGLSYQLGFDSFPRSPFEKSALYLQKTAGAHSLIINDDKLSFFPIHFYAPDLSQSFLEDTPGTANDTLAPATQNVLGLAPQKDLAEAVGAAQEVYFVVFDETIQEYRQMGQDHPHLAWLGSHFKNNSQMGFNDLWVYHFSVPQK